MSHTRLRQKADLYAAYTEADAWQARTFSCRRSCSSPPPNPGRRFLADSNAPLTPAVETAAAARGGRRRPRTAARPAAREPPRVSNAKSHWLLPDVLDAARAPYEQTQPAQRAGAESRASEPTVARDPTTAPRRCGTVARLEHHSLLSEELGSSARSVR